MVCPQALNPPQRSCASPGAPVIPLEEFLRPFFDPGETVCLRVFDDKKRGAFKGAKLECEAGKIGSMMDTLRKHNTQSRGIYFVINHGGHEDADISRINAQFVECDSKPLEEQAAALEAFPLPPSLVVRTKKSLHAYWLTRDAKVEQFRRVQKALIAGFDGDPACVNESRVFRLPGFNHCKGEPVPVECVAFHPELRYSQEQLLAALPAVADDPAPAAPAPKGARKGLALVGKRCLFLQHCRDNAATLSEFNWYAMITNLAVFEGGDRAIHALSKTYPGYSRAETEGKIAHFLNSGTKPMTCTKIAEGGFRCPKLEDGSCGCKAPAALCYKAPDLDTLRALLADAPLGEDTLANIAAAQEFVQAYLYNVDGVIAAAFINYELKARFALKAADLRPLLALHKELYKAHRDSREARMETEELPDWYEPTERGGLKFLPAVLAEHMAGSVDAFYSAEQYFVYRDGVYSAVPDLEARRMTRSFMNPRYTLMSNITDAEGQWRMLCMRPLREINPNAYMINVRNGLYNVLDGTFAPHSPEYLSTVQLNVRYSPGAQCPRFTQFLAESLGKADIPLVQEMLGYFLLPVNKAQKSFVIVGEPGAGKSKLLLTLNEILLGQENVSNIPWQSLNERFKTAELFGKLANIFADLPTKNIDDNGIFKALVGEDFLTAERKNKDPFTFQPYARLLFSCNAIPRNYGDKSEGFYRRLIIIRFSTPVPEEKRDAELLDKFAVEADGIFLFALEGLRRLIANKYRFSETQATRAELQRYRIDSNSVLSFVEECCELSPDAEIERDELFGRYRDYCNNAGLKELSKTAFNKDLETNYPGIKRATDKLGKRRTWRGIQMDSGGEPGDMIEI